MDACYEHIKLNPNGKLLTGMCLMGNIFCTVSEMELAIGDRHGHGNELTQSAEWWIETPRGRVAIADHHTLPEAQLMIAAEDIRGARWVCAYLRKLGIRSHIGAVRRTQDEENTV